MRSILFQPVRQRLSNLLEQPDGGLLDKLVFGVGVGHSSKRVSLKRALNAAFWEIPAIR
jgi:hypothetical protein